MSVDARTTRLLLSVRLQLLVGADVSSAPTPDVRETEAHSTGWEMGGAQPAGGAAAALLRRFVGDRQPPPNARTAPPRNACNPGACYPDSEATAAVARRRLARARLPAWTLVRAAECDPGRGSSYLGGARVVPVAAGATDFVPAAAGARAVLDGAWAKAAATAGAADSGGGEGTAAAPLVAPPAGGVLQLTCALCLNTAASCVVLPCHHRFACLSCCPGDWEAEARLGGWAPWPGAAPRRCPVCPPPPPAAERR